MIAATNPRTDPNLNDFCNSKTRLTCLPSLYPPIRDILSIRPRLSDDMIARLREHRWDRNFYE